MLLQLIVSGIVSGSLYTLVALGMTVLYRSTTVVNFCHGEFFMLGAFGVVVAQQGLHLGYGASIVVALVFMAAVGGLTERFLMRPLREAPFVTLAMMTVALSYLLKGAARFFYGREVVPLAPLLDGDPIEIGSAVVMPQDALIVGFTAVVVVALFVFFQRTHLGKVIQAASQAPRGAQLVGIDVPLLRNATWALGALLGAVAGILIAPNTLVYPDMGGQMLIRAFAAMCLGGFGSFPGAVLGGLALGVVENAVGGFVSSALVDVTPYLVIVAVLIARPQGLLGEWKAVRG